MNVCFDCMIMKKTAYKLQLLVEIAMLTGIFKPSIIFRSLLARIFSKRLEYPFLTNFNTTWLVFGAMLV